MPDRLEEYLGTVREQVRWKRARDGATQELRTHLLDQRDAYLEQGMDEEAATKESVRQMGDPVEVGVALDRVHRPKPQWGLLALVGVLLCMGYGAQLLLRDVALASPNNLEETFYESRWLVGAVIGVVLLFAVYFLDYTLLARRPLLCYWAGVLILIGVFNRSHRINGRYFEIQFWMLLAPVLLAVLIYAMRGKRWFGLLVSIGGSALLAGLALLIPNITIALLVFGAGVLMTILSVWRGWMGLPVKRTMTGIGIFLFLFVLWLWACVVTSEYVSRRLQMAIDPAQDPLGYGYHALAVRSLLSDAKWIGQGDVTFMGYRSAELMLPEIASSTLLTWVIHRLGWAAGIALIGVFVLLLGWMARKALKHRGMLGSLIALAVVFTLAVQVGSFVLFNLGLPLLGIISLPLVSYGHWAMLANMVLIGLALSVFREESLPVQNGKLQTRKQMPLTQLIFWKDGDLVIGFSRLRQVR